MNIFNVRDTLEKELIKTNRQLLPVEEAVKSASAELADSEEFRELFLKNNFTDAFNQVFSEGFVSDSYIEKIPQYEQGEKTSLQQLADENLISHETAKLFAAYFDTDTTARLYQHQREAVKAVAEGKNILVCSGTGSGKTEAFLIPLFDALIKERKECKNEGKAYSKGIRAMILYPMNALVNDQVRRIRKILKGAEQNDIEYARDISFGTYTGETKRISEEIPLRRPNQDEERAIKEGEKHCAASLTHSYLSEETPAKNELIKRSSWLEEPGDILVTNYSMLERLMLDPETARSMFSPTWRFIILDEAHTYDGAVGTEIAWLIRRVVARTQSKEMRYMATSATLVPTDGTKEGNASAAKVIKEEFASKIFPAHPDSFEVLFGTERTSFPCDKHVDKLLDEHDYVQLVNAPANLSNEILEHNVLKPEHRHKFTQVPENLEGMSLMALTQWTKCQLGQFSRFSYLMQHSDDAPVAFGDAVALARTVAILCPGEKLGLTKALSRAALFALFPLMDKTQDEQRDIIQTALGCHLKSRATEIAEKILKFANEEEEAYLEADYFELLAMLIQEHSNNLRDCPDVLTWNVQWTDKTLEVLRSCVRYCQDLECFYKLLQNHLLTRWKDLCNAVDVTSIQECVTLYLLQRRHVYSLNDFIQSCKKSPSDCRWSLAKNAVFQNETGNDSELDAKLDALVQLLGLSQYERRPLMDLRFHQTISGISCIAVWFDDEHKPHFLRDEEALSCKHDGKERRLYTLGLCRKCGHPYLLGYSDSPAEDGDFSVTRYPDERYNKLVAFSWIPTKNHSRATHYLDANSGEVFSEQEDGALALYVVDWANNDEVVSRRIPDCQVCDSSYNARGDFAQITPYHNGDELRCAALESIIHLVDPDYTTAGAHSGGRKVLAFSDSRDAAARLVVRYEELNNERILRDIIFKHLSAYGDPTMEMNDDAMEELYQFFPGGCYGSARESQERGKRALLDDQDLDEEAIQQIENLYDKAISKLNGRFRKQTSTLAAFLPITIKLLRQVGADLLLEREYEHISDVNHRDRIDYDSFGEGASASLSLLSVLRSTKRHSLLKDGYISVVSRRCNSNDKQEWSSLLIDGFDWESLRNFLQEWYRYLFENCVMFADTSDDVHCDYIYDRGKGLHYSDGENNRYALNGCDSHPKKFIVKVNTNRNDQDDEYSNSKYVNLGRVGGTCKFRSLLRHYLPGIRNADLIAFAEKLFNALIKNEVILKDPHDTSAYGLNLEDLSIEITDAGRKYLDSQQNIINDDRLSVRIEEHTAQLSTYRGRLYQSGFAEGKINILSCSTTFEMGVDLGGLNCVFMANMPPSVANYRQRAGRAGRRAGASSFVFTYIGSSSHDRNFKQHPDTLFFAPVKKPQIYLDNPIFRARHMRAEALHMYLKWCGKTKQDVHWKLCSDFFGLGTAQPSLVAALPEWAEKCGEEVQNHCEGIVAMGNQNAALNYHVAADLCWQTLGYGDNDANLYDKLFRKDHSREIEEDDYVFRQLGGPHLPEYSSTHSFWVAPTSVRIALRYEDADDAGKRHIRNSQTVDEMAHSQILPMYGFPSDVVELKPQRNANVESAKLKRDMKIAIFDYAPGQKVIADKRCYTSQEPKQYKNPGGQGEAEHEAREKICYCPKCQEYYKPTPGNKEESKCIYCGHQIPDDTQHRHDAIIPDYFKADSGRKASSNDYSEPIYRQMFLAGEKIDDVLVMEVSGTQLEAYNSRRREIIYLNSATSDENSNAKNKANDDKNNAKINPCPWLMHRVRADVILWRLKGESADALPYRWSPVRMRDAWKSALQAILKAAAEVLDINRKDIGGIVIERDGRLYLVLFDDSASGSGALLNIMKVKNGNEKHNKQADENIQLILKRAVELCESCNCYKEVGEGNNTPYTHHEYLLKKDEETCREFRSCYSCLRTYTNQRDHARLDAHDAAVILEGMLGNGNESGGMQQLDKSQQLLEPQPLGGERKQGGENQQGDAGLVADNGCPLGAAPAIVSCMIPPRTKFRVWEDNELHVMEWLNKSARSEDCADMIRVSDMKIVRNVRFANIYPL